MIASASIYRDLKDEQIQELEQLPPAERIEQLALIRQATATELVEELATDASLPIVSKFELVENPTANLPLRLIHEYQCVPIADEDEQEAKDNAPAGPLKLSPIGPERTNGSLDLCDLRARAGVASRSSRAGD